ncbi:MAG TPA: class I SAM-dependent methyltransferase [Candidatus Acidoferrales bacterium]|nr:class I SAM-dependent methyltransferase [Candidatus Acidoferrales bacterium]
MLGMRYVKHPLSVLRDLIEDPAETWTSVRESYIAHREQRRPQCLYESNPSWELRLHADVGAQWPCNETPAFFELWPKVINELESHGIQAGPMSFLGWNDGDRGFVRAVWCLTRHLKPDKVVETGVAHGVTSRFLLEALERNGKGRLFSIDLPPFERAVRKQIGVAVEDRFRTRWKYIKGSSRRRLSGLLSELGQIDLFIHDSLHSEHNVRFEMDLAWAALRPGGALVVDDVDANWGFRSFLEDCSGQESIICDAEPLRPDLRRFNKKGLFGIVIKQGPA